MDTHWRQRAACKDVDPALFFPEDGHEYWRCLACKKETDTAEYRRRVG